MAAAILVSVEEAARRIGIGRTLAYSLCRAFEAGQPGGLRCVRLGRRLLVPVSAIEELEAARFRQPHRRPADERQATQRRVAGRRSAELTPRVCVGVQAAAVRRVGPTSWAVLEVLASAGDEADDVELVAMTSVRRIADELGLSKDTVAAALSRLIDAGIVRRESVRFAPGRYLIVAEVGLRRCPSSSCPKGSATNISDSRTPRDAMTEHHTEDRYDTPAASAPQRLFE